MDDIDAIIRKHKISSIITNTDDRPELLEILLKFYPHHNYKNCRIITTNYYSKYYFNEDNFLFEITDTHKLYVNPYYIKSHIYKFRNLKGGLDKIIKQWISYYYGFDLIDYYTYSDSKCLTIEKNYLV